VILLLIPSAQLGGGTIVTVEGTTSVLESISRVGIGITSIPSSVLGSGVSEVSVDIINKERFAFLLSSPSGEGILFEVTNINGSFPGWSGDR